MTQRVRRPYLVSNFLRWWACPEVWIRALSQDPRAGLLIGLAVLSSGILRAEPLALKAIFGEDDRRDLYQIQDERILRLADSTVALFWEPAIVEEGEDRVRLLTTPYGKSNQLCPEEPFYDQPSGSFCSGFLVAPDLVATSAHCLPSEGLCPKVRFVFGFSIPKEGRDPTRIPAGDVYGCKKVFGLPIEKPVKDWALVLLNRRVSDHKPLALSQAVSIEQGTSVFSIGYPEGLPTKVAGGARVNYVSSQGYFEADLDIFAGSSGSPVFHGASHLVEGIVTRGEEDYEWRGNCRVSKRYSDDGRRGTYVIKLWTSPSGMATVRASSPKSRDSRGRPIFLSLIQIEPGARGEDLFGRGYLFQ